MDTIPDLPTISASDRAAIRDAAASFTMSGGRPTPSSPTTVSRTPTGNLIPGSQKRAQRPSLELSPVEAGGNAGSVDPTPTTSMAQAFTGFGLNAASRAPPALNPQASSTAQSDGLGPESRGDGEKSKDGEDAEMLDQPDSPEPKQ